MNELKPCPFCGGEARRIDIDATKPSVPDAGASYIACGRCYACSPIMFGEKTGLEESWNRRALSTIDPDAKPKELSKDVRDFTLQLTKSYDTLGVTYKRLDCLDALITAHDERIRNEYEKVIKLKDEARINNIHHCAEVIKSSNENTRQKALLEAAMEIEKIKKLLQDEYESQAGESL